MHLNIRIKYHAELIPLKIVEDKCNNCASVDLTNMTRQSIKKIFLTPSVPDVRFLDARMGYSSLAAHPFDIHPSKRHSSPKL